MRFLSKTQLVMINQMQDILTRRSLSTAYKRTTKTSGLKRLAFDLSLSVVSYMLKNLVSGTQVFRNHVVA